MYQFIHNNSIIIIVNSLNANGMPNIYVLYLYMQSNMPWIASLYRGHLSICAISIVIWTEYTGNNHLLIENMTYLPFESSLVREVTSYIADVGLPGYVSASSRACRHKTRLHFKHSSSLFTRDFQIYVIDILSNNGGFGLGDTGYPCCEFDQ